MINYRNDFEGSGRGGTENNHEKLSQYIRYPKWPCNSSGGYSPTYHRGGPVSSPGHVGFLVDKVALGQVFSEYFDFPCQFSFHRLLHTHHLSSGAGTIGQTMAGVSSGLSLTPPQETWRDSNRVPPECEPTALSLDLPVRRLSIPEPVAWTSISPRDYTESYV
jgi:hypothetical protein